MKVFWEKSVTANAEHKLYSSWYLAHSFPSSSFTAREYSSLSLRLDFLPGMLLDFAREKHKPKNLLDRNFPTLNIKRTSKLEWNGFFCNQFKWVVRKPTHYSRIAVFFLKMFAVVSIKQAAQTCQTKMRFYS